jgi:hypothetical protein
MARNGGFLERVPVLPTVCIERIVYERRSDLRAPTEKAETLLLRIAKMPEERHRDIVQRVRTAQAKNTD